LLGILPGIVDRNPTKILQAELYVHVYGWSLNDFPEDGIGSRIFSMKILGGLSFSAK
jgi:hypothetical protein